MAAPQFEGGKIKTLDHLTHMLAHDEKEARITKQHKNAHINKELTPLNFSYRNLSMAERMEKVADVLSKCKNFNPDQTGESRNDIVILHSVILYPPDEVGNDPKKAKEWFNQVGIPSMVKIFGEERILDVDVHFDEIHEFIDPDTHKKKISKIHAHVLIIPTEEREAEKYVKDENGVIIKDPVFDKDGNPVWQIVKKTGKIRLDRKGNPVQKTKRRKAPAGTKEIVLNAKKVTGPVNIKKLNKELDQQTQELFGFSYHSGKGKATYINEAGEEVKDARTVEQLKIASIEAADDEIAEQEEKKKELESEIGEKEERKKELSDEIADQEDILAEQEEELNENAEIVTAAYLDLLHALGDDRTEDDFDGLDADDLYAILTEKINDLKKQADEMSATQNALADVAELLRESGVDGIGSYDVFRLPPGQALELMFRKSMEFLHKEKEDFNADKERLLSDLDAKVDDDVEALKKRITDLEAVKQEAVEVQEEAAAKTAALDGGIDKVLDRLKQRQNNYSLSID